jgi:hypothetical protein
MVEIVDDVGMRRIERAGRRNVAIALLGDRQRDSLDARVRQSGDGGRGAVLRIDEFAQGPDDAAIVDAGIIAQPARIEPILRAQRRAEQRRAQVDSDDAPVAALRLQHVVSEFGLVATVKGADADMRHADSDPAPIIGGKADARFQVREGRRCKPPHVRLPQSVSRA